MESRPTSVVSAIRRLGLAALAALLLVGLAGTQAAWAHALYVRSTPAPEQLLQKSPSDVRITFSEDLNAPACRIIVWNRDRQVENVGVPHLVSGQPRELEIALKPLARGAYLVLWTSVSAADGHVLHGAFLFYVKKRGPGPSLAGVDTGGPGQTFPDGPTLSSIVAHWVELSAAVVWVGTEAFFLFVLIPVLSGLTGTAHADEERRRMWLVRASLVLLMLASMAVMLMLAYNLAGDWKGTIQFSTWSDLIVAQYGKLWIARQAIALLALIMTLVPQRKPALSPSLAAAAASPSRREPVSLTAVGLGAIYLYLFAGSGHAASANIGQIAGSAVFTGAVAVDWLHFVADALWLGGQVYILAVLIPAGGIARRPTAMPVGSFLDALNRFSPLAYVSVALFTLSGVFSAYVHVPGFYAFFDSVYGKTLIIKIVLIGLMMGVSVLTVFIIRPRLRGMLWAGPDAEPQFLPMLRALVFFLRLNPLLGAGVLLATSVLFYYPVPFGFGPPGPSSYTIHGSGLTAVLSVSPNRSGINTVRVSLTNQAHQPVEQAQVTALTTMLDMVMGTGVNPLQEKQSGVFSGPVELSMGGHWRMLLLIYQPAGLTRLTVDVRIGT